MITTSRFARMAATALLGVAMQLLPGSSAMAQGVAAGEGASEAARHAALLAAGQRIYRDGVTSSGAPLTAPGAAQARLSGKDAACATCHRRSGFGSTEGQFVIRPVTAQALFQEQTLVVRAPRIKARLGSSVRPPYTDASLARAIRSGLDASDKPLDAVMPRYALGDDDMKALTAYLHTLSAQPSPGVDEEDIHFATVIQPGVAPERRRAMLDVMQAFVKDKDANVRSEELRREAGTMRMYRAYRKWVLDVWDLNGPSETWGAQLESYYAKRPVFALVGGLGNASWRPIHEFSERFEVPSVFPQVDLPLLDGSSLYNFYFSRGVTLEAEVLAKFLRDQGEAGKLLQVYRQGEAGAAAAGAFRAALGSGTRATLEDLVLDGPSDEAFWRRVAAVNPAAAALWLNAEDLAASPATVGIESAPVYLSYSLLGGKRSAAVKKFGGNVRMVYPSDLAPRHDARLLRNMLWFHQKGIAITDEGVQVNTQFAMTVVSDVLGHMADSFSRDYFVERVEHAVGQTPMPSIYPQISLGPGQRFAAKGSSIVELQGGDKPGLKALSGWIVP